MFIMFRCDEEHTPFAVLDSHIFKNLSWTNLNVCQMCMCMQSCVQWTGNDLPVKKSKIGNIEKSWRADMGDVIKFVSFTKAFFLWFVLVYNSHCLLLTVIFGKLLLFFFIIIFNLVSCFKILVIRGAFRSSYLVRFYTVGNNCQKVYVSVRG